VVELPSKLDFGGDPDNDPHTGIFYGIYIG